MTDEYEIARIELCEALATLSDYIPGAEAFDKTSEALLAVANAWYRAGEASQGARSIVIAGRRRGIEVLPIRRNLPSA